MNTLRRTPPTPRITALALLATVALSCARAVEPLDAPGDTDDATSAPAVRAALGDTVAVDVGATARIEAAGVSVTFVVVAGDSRCPLNVTCVWQGDGEVVLDLRSEGAARRVVLHTGVDPRAAEFGGVIIELVGLSPEPVDDPLTDPTAYRAFLVARPG